MSCEIIIFGAGHDGQEALDFFGIENCFCFVDNNPKLTGKTVKGLNILSFEQLLQLYQENPLFSKNAFEVVIAISFDRWAVHSIASKLKKADIFNFSIFIDVKRRWKSGHEFLQRDRDIFPCEQEYIQKIYLAQGEWLLRHTDPMKLLPAVGEMRENQKKATELAFDFFEEIEAAINVKPILSFGSLLGAVRHKGFIPWDSDMDFYLPRIEHIKLYDYLVSHCGIYHLRDDNWVKVNEEQFPNDIESPYIAFCVADTIHLRRTDTLVGGIADSETNNKVFLNDYPPYIADIAPLDYYPEFYTDKDFNDDHIKWKTKTKHLKVYDIVNIWRQSYSKMPPSGNYKLGASIADLCYVDSIFSTFGKNTSNFIWNYDDIFDLQKLPFEDKWFWAPKNPGAILSKMYNPDYMQLPERYGVWVHNKDAVLHEIY